MSDNNANTNTNEPNTSTVEGTNNEPNGSNVDEMTPEDLRAALKKARKDSQQYRSQAEALKDKPHDWVTKAEAALSTVEKLENEKKSEVEKLTEQNAQALHRADSSENQLTRIRIALAAGVDPSQVDDFAGRLQGNNESELTEDAAKLIKLFTPTNGNATNTTRRSDPAQGAGGGGNQTVDSLKAALDSKLGISR